MKSTILISVLACSLSLSAQTNKEKFVPMIKKSIGVSFQSFDGLNSRISGFPEYEKLKDHMFTISLGSMHVINNFVSQFTATAGSSLTGHSDRKSSAIRSLGAAFDIGYDVIPADKIMLYPLAGIGAESYHAVFYKDNSSVQFDDVLESPAVQNDIRSVKFTNAFITYRLGLGFALKSPKGYGTVGIQAGYSGSFKDRAWRSSENQVLAGAPVDKLSRFSVSLVLTGNKMMMK